MLNLSRTSTVLLEGLRDPTNSEAWETFDQLYRPVVIGFARRLGLADADAADIAQETMAQFVQEYRADRYDRTRGRLRTWLIALAKSRIAVLRRSDSRRRHWRGDSALVDLANESELTRIWEDERRATALRHAMDQLREKTRAHDKTIQAFELVVVNRVPAPAVAKELGMTTHDVYLAKGRIAHMLRGILRSIDAAFDDVPAGASAALGAQPSC